MNLRLLPALREDLENLAEDVDQLLEQSGSKRPVAVPSSRRPRVLILGASFAGLETAQKIRRYTRDRVDLTVVDRKPYLLFVPNLLTNVLANRDPGKTLHMPVDRPLLKDKIRFLLGEVREIDVERNRVRVSPTERSGTPDQTVSYDYLVIALGNSLAYDAIPGFATYGHTLTDTFHANRLRHFLHHEYRGGPIVIGSARFHQGSALREWIPTTEAACEGPVVETIFSLGDWLKRRRIGNGRQITFFTPGSTFAVEAGGKAVAKLLQMAAQMGYGCLTDVIDIATLTRDGVEFANGQQAEAELMIIVPDWVPHGFLQGLPVSDDRGFVLTDASMRNPRWPNVMAVGDAAAATVPKLGYLAHLQSDVVAWQIAAAVGVRPSRGAPSVFRPVVDCFGTMGASKGFFLRSDAWYGGDTQIMKAGPVPYYLKALYKSAFFMMRGKVPNWSVTAANYVGDYLSLNML